MVRRRAGAPTPRLSTCSGRVSCTLRLCQTPPGDSDRRTAAKTASDAPSASARQVERLAPARALPHVRDCRAARAPPDRASPRRRGRAARDRGAGVPSTSAAERRRDERRRPEVEAAEDRPSPSRSGRPRAKQSAAQTFTALAPECPQDRPPSRSERARAAQPHQRLERAPEAGRHVLVAARLGEPRQREDRQRARRVLDARSRGTAPSPSAIALP